MGGSINVDLLGASRAAAVARLGEVRLDGVDIEGACHRVCRGV